MSKEATKEIITAYKGFDSDMKCRGFQYEVGKTYVHEGEVKACESGFHACEYPLDVFGYYAPAGNSFAIVEQSGNLSRHDEDSKVASSKIKVEAQIDFAGLVKAAVEYTASRCKPVDHDSPASSTGDYGAASSTGYQGAASSTGAHSVAMACGHESKAKAGETGAIVLVRRDDDGEIVHIRASKIGENGIKPNVWYELDADGQFVEVK